MRTVRESFAVSVVGNMIHGHGKYLCEPHSVNSQCTQHSVPQCASVCLSVPQCIASAWPQIAKTSLVIILPSTVVHWYIFFENQKLSGFYIINCNCVSLGYDHVQQTKHTHRVLSGFVAKFSPKTHDIVLLLYCEYRVGKWKFCLNMTLCAALVSNS